MRELVGKRHKMTTIYYTYIMKLYNKILKKYKNIPNI